MAIPELSPAPATTPNKFGGDPVAFDMSMQAWLEWQATRSAQDPALLTWIDANTDAVVADRAQTGADRVQTGLDRVQTGLDVASAEASRIAASKLNLGSKATAPTLDNQGAALLAGANYYDTTLNRWRVWTGSEWGDGVMPIPGLLSVPIYLNSLEAIDETRILTGPYKDGYLMAPNGYLNVYFATLGLIQVVEERIAESKAFVELVIYTLCSVNDGVFGQYVIFDIENFQTAPTRKRPDSNDSYAALINLLAYEAAKASEDWVWYAAHIARLKDIAFYNLTQPIKTGAGVPGTGMTRTFQTPAWGPYYDVCLTEDNCEVYAGLDALSKGCAQLGLADAAFLDDALYYANSRDGVGASMNNPTTGVWDDVNKHWLTSDGRGDLGRAYYADAVTQVFPELWSVKSGSGAETDRQRYNFGWVRLNQLAPQWETAFYDSFPWFLMGLAATIRGSYHQAEAQINHVLRTRTRAMYTINELGHRRKMEKLFFRRGLDIPAIGYLNTPQNRRSSGYTCVLSDSGKHIYHPSTDTTARTYTIPAHASVAYPMGTQLTFVNDTSAGVVTISINADVLVLAGTGAVGSRTLAANGIATAIKVTNTRWMISGTGLT